MSEKISMNDSDNQEKIESNEEKSWQYIKTYGPSIAQQKEYMESKMNRIYRRKADGKVYVSYEDRPSRYSQGMY